MLDAGRMRFFGFVLGACVFLRLLAHWDSGSGAFAIFVLQRFLVPRNDRNTEAIGLGRESWLVSTVVLFCTRTVGKVLDITSAQIDSKPSTLFGFRPGLKDLRTASRKEDLMPQIQGLMADAARLS